MNSVPRKIGLGLALTAFVAACGDDVTVEEQTPATPVVRSVVVSPSSATIAPGGSFTFGASVDADAGLARTVTWSSSNSAVASVDGNGLASAPTSSPGGSVSICAASTVETDIQSCAQLTVTAAPPVQPATVDIAAVTDDCDVLSQANPAAIPGVCGFNVPVSVNNVYGQITVHTNVNRPAGSTATHVILDVLNAAGSVEHADTVTLSQTAANAGEELAAQASNEVRFSFNTAHYTIDGAGVVTVRHSNGQKRVRVRLIGAGAAATAERQYTFNNIDGFHLAVTTDLSASALNANGVSVRASNAGGLSYNGGTPLALRASAVSYTGAVVAATTGTTIGFGSAACDLSGVGARGGAAAVSNNVLTGTLTYANGSGGAAGNVNAYEWGGVGCPVTGETPFATGITAAGDPFITTSLFGAFGPANTLNAAGGQVNPLLPAAPTIRLDNRGPTTGAFTIINTPNGRGPGTPQAWFNDAVVLNAANTSATSNGTVTATPADAGIGGTVTRRAYVCAAGSSATGCAGTASPPGAGVTSVTGEPETNVVTLRAFIVAAFDVFLNRSLSNGPLGIGIDRTVPSCVAQTTGTGGADVPADGSISLAAATGGAAGTAAFVGVDCFDGLSGFVPASTSIREVLLQVNGSAAGLVRTRLIPAATGTATSTPFATAGTGAAPTATFVNTAQATPAYAPIPTGVRTTATAVAAAAGYYIYQARATDQAANQSAMVVRRFYLNEAVEPAVTALDASANYTGGAAASFPGTGTDPTEVISGELRVAYPNIGGNFVYSRPTPTIETIFDDAMPIPAAAPFAVSQFIRGVQFVDGAHAPTADFATAKPTAVRGRVYNPYGNSLGLFAALNPQVVNAGGAPGVSPDFTSTITAAQVATGTDFSTVTVARRITAWGNFAPAPAPSCGGVSGGARTCTLVVIARGPTNTFLNPFPGGLLVLDAATGTTDGRVIFGPGAVVPAGYTVTVTPNFDTVTGTPTLDNGVDRDYNWTVTIRRPTGATRDISIGGVNAGFDALLTNITTFVF